MSYLGILEVLLPIFTALLVGAYCKKTSIIDDNALNKIKNLIFDIILPLVLFNSFLFADFSGKSYIYIIAVFIGMLVSFLLGNVFKKIYIKKYSDYLPETVTSWEAGTIGVALCSMLYGTFGIRQMAIFDFGAALFFYILLAPMLSIKDGKKAKPKDLIKMLFSSKIFDCMILGGILGILGVGKIINDNIVASTIYHGIVDIILSPTNFLIMFFVGYSLNINKKLIFPVISTCLIRIICCSISLIIGYLIIFNFMPFDKRVLVVLMIGYSLPPGYAIPVFTNFRNREELKELFSDVASFMVVFTLILFVFISIYALNGGNV